MKRIKLSLTSFFLLTVIAAVTMALIASRWEVSQLDKELNSIVPLRPLEVAAQIERQTAAAKLPVTVDVSNAIFSGSTWLVAFEYLDPKTGQKTRSNFNLRYEHTGKHVGVIRDDPFLSPEPDQGGERGLRIEVIDPMYESLVRENQAKLLNSSDASISGQSR